MTTTSEERPGSSAHTETATRHVTWWKVVVSAMLVLWLGAQFVAGWKFANGQTYPVVGSAMFNGPPSGAASDFLMPRVFLVDADGTRAEIDQQTFGLEPFEWRRWIKRHLEDVDDAHAHEWAAELDEVVARMEPGMPSTAAVEVWRVPAQHDTLDGGVLIRRVEL